MGDTTVLYHAPRVWERGVATVQPSHHYRAAFSVTTCVVQDGTKFTRTGSNMPSKLPPPSADIFT